MDQNAARDSAVAHTAEMIGSPAPTQEQILESGSVQPSASTPDPLFIQPPAYKEPLNSLRNQLSNEHIKANARAAIYTALVAESSANPLVTDSSQPSYLPPQVPSDIKNNDVQLTGNLFGPDGGLPPAIVKTLTNVSKTVQTQVDTVRDLIDPFIPFENILASSIVLGTVAVTWFLTYFRWGYGWYVVGGLMLADMYRRNQSRLKVKIAKELYKQSAILKLNDDTEHVEWLNLFLSKFWTIYEPELSQQIKETVDGVLESSKPAFLDDLRLVKFTLGSNAPRIESIRTYPGAEADVLMMDWDLSFTPFDVDDLSKKDKANSGIYNFHMELVARIGAGPASIPLSILLKEVAFSGEMRIQLKFITAYPHIGMVEFGFLNVPRLDFILRPLKGMDLKDIPGLSTFLEDTINGQLRAAIVNPNKISIDLAAMMNAGDSADRPIGVLRVTIFDAKQLKNVDITGISDPCAVIIIGGKEVARTNIIDNNLDPVWNETFNIIVYKSTFGQLASRSDEFKIDIMHVNALQRKLIGSTPTLRLQRWSRLLDPVSVEELPDDIPPELKRDQMRPMTRSEHESLISNWGTPLSEPSDIIKQLSRPGQNEKRTGQLRLDLSYFPIPEVAPEVPLDSRAGVLSISVHQAKELAASKSAFPECSIEMDNVVIGRTSIKKHTNTPTWNFSCNTYCKNIDTAKIRFVVTERGSSLGDCNVEANTLIKPEKDDWFKLYHTTGGKLRITAKFIPVDMLHITTDTSKIKRKEPCGLLRINVRKAEALANTEVLRKSDPYIKVNAGGKPFGATHVRQNTLDPEWNEIFYCIVSTPKDPILFEAFDWNELRGDKRLGKIELRLDMLLPDNPELGGNKPDEKLAEMIESLTSDGFSATPTSSSKASIRTPLYLSKSDELPSNGKDEPEEDEEEAKAAAAAAATAAGTKSKFTPAALFKKDMFKMPVLPTSTPKIRQRGHLYFDVDYFPVIKDRVIRPRSENPALSTASAARSRSASETAKKDNVDATNPTTATGITTIQDDIKLVEKVAETIKDDAKDIVKSVSSTDLKVDANPPTKSEIEPMSSLAKRIVDQNRSGILRIRITGAKLARPARAYIEIHVDGTAIFRTRTSEETMNPMWLEAADKFIIDMDTDAFLILMRHQIGEERSSNDFILAQWQGDPVTELIGTSHEELKMRQYTTSGRSNDHLPYIARLKAEFWYAPVNIDMDISSKFNSGMLNIDIIEAKGLSSADRNGLSDPYCVFNINGTRIHKTKVQKHTLDPVFNEQVSVAVKSRLRSTLEIQMMDWDAVGAHTYLGRVLIHLADLPASEVVNQVYPLEDGKGSVTLRFFFVPQTVDEKGSNLDPESRLEAGSQSGVGKFYKGLTTSFANTAANTFMSGFGKKPQTGGGAASKSTDLRYGLEGGRRRELSGPIESTPVGATGSEPSSRQIPAGPPSRRPMGVSSNTTSVKNALETTGVLDTAANVTDLAHATVASVSAQSSEFLLASAQAIENHPAVKNASSIATGSAESLSHLANSSTSEKFPEIYVRSPSPVNQTLSSVDNFTAQVMIEILQGRGLTAVDTNGTSDPYVRVMQYKNSSAEFKTLLKTAVIKKTTSPVWTNESVVVHCPPPTIRIVIKDHNTFKGSVDMGQIGLDLFGLFKNTNTFDEYFPVDGGDGELRIRGTLISNGVDASDTASMVEKKRSFFGFKKNSELNNSNGGSPIEIDAKRSTHGSLFSGFRRSSGASIVSVSSVQQKSSMSSIQDSVAQSEH
ncbi:hypothetical protein BDV3_006107 [Batrachochytrium dendrobatidis]